MHEIWLMFELSNYNSSWFMSQLIQGKSWLDVNKCEKLPLNLGTPKRRSAWEIDGEPLFFLVTCDCRGFYYFCIGLFFGETFGKSKEKGWKKTILEKKNPFFLGVHVFFLFIQCHFFWYQMRKQTAHLLALCSVKRLEKQDT